VVWWRRRAQQGTSIPSTIGEALELSTHLARPKQISLRPAGKFTEIVGYRYFDADPYHVRIY